MIETAARAPKGRALVTGTMWQALAQLVPLALNLGLTPYFIRGLGHDRYSVFLLVNTLSVLLASVNGGIGPASMRAFSLNAGTGDAQASTRLLWTVSWIFVGMTAVLTAIGILGAPALLDFFSLAPELREETLVLVRVLAVLVGLLMVRNSFNTLLLAHGRFRITSTAVLLGYAVYTVGMTLSIERGWGLIGVGVTFILQQILSTCVTVPPALAYLRRSGVRWMHRAEATEFFAYAWKAQITGILTVVTAQKDQLVAGRLLTAQHSGPYGQGSSFAQQLRILPVTALAPLQSSIGRSVGETGVPAAAPHANAIQRVWVRAVTGWIAVGLPATYFGVLTWLPDSFAVSAQVATILTAGTFFTLVPAVLIVWCQTVGHPELELRYSLAGLATNLVCSLVLGFAFGIIGVVVGTALSQAAATAWLGWDSRRTLAVRLDGVHRSIPARAAALALALTFAAEALAFGHLPRGGLGLVACGVLAVPGALAYALLVFGREGLGRVLRRVPVVRRTPRA